MWSRLVTGLFAKLSRNIRRAPTPVQYSAIITAAYKGEWFKFNQLDRKRKFERTKSGFFY